MIKKFLFIFISFFSLFIFNVYADVIKNESASVKVGGVSVPIYNVEVVWGKMEFIYNEQVNYIWNDEEYIYELGESTYKWINNGNYVDVSNKSYSDINVNLEYISLKDGIDGAFDVSNKNILVNTSSRFVLTLNGGLDGFSSNYVKVGAINLKIS